MGTQIERSDIELHFDNKLGYMLVIQNVYCHNAVSMDLILIASYHNHFYDILNGSWCSKLQT